MTALCHVPLIASGGAGCIDDFSEVFLKTSVSGALAASVFHEKTLTISEVKSALKALQIRVR
jgi:cyclase